MKSKLSTKLILFSIIILAAVFRLYNLNWDQGHHLHPDERAIIMTVVKLQFPQNLETFFTKESPWNPHFFAYGSFPFYLLKIVGESLTVFDPEFAKYGLITLAGRFISSLFDIGSLITLFYIGKKLYGTKTGYIAALLYAVSVLPIQLSHFYAVDTLLTFFTLSVIYQLIKFHEKPTLKRALIVGVFIGLSVATKVSSIVLLVAITAAFTIDVLSLFLKHPRKHHMWFPDLKDTIKNSILYAIPMFIASCIIFALTSPYAIIDFHEFWRQTQDQSRMTRSAFTFPYTLQYVNKIPYWHELKNIFLWGLGPLIAVFAFTGTIQFLIKTITRKHQKIASKESIIAVFFITYFLIVGKFAIGFVRYMLPLYPLFCLFAALAVHNFIELLKNKIKHPLILNTVYIILYTILLLWPLSFIRIYDSENTRVKASNWIYDNIPADKVLAVEHWDDQLPIGRPITYQTQTLALYEHDTDEKWQMIHNQLSQTDYIILASNRLYTPLPKLTDCESLPQGVCYERTASYYEGLFAGTIGFQKVAEFTSFPRLPLLNIPIIDQEADESFTVYDHPKVIIFQKIGN